eukprot:CAMPEP_0196601920 /NCGR_PEP_ID=MMETSP1081-20130531/96160_1 /TAXON_ID=36882 /ORGANISM="Pyramimonas amylifera, Strain CCMP720" /LENGTH=652 /DNA_ID=CAMNT_0041927817 /DNA_START=79 /DNA_END=2037 /DNA_ORIENTATION=-
MEVAYLKGTIGEAMTEGCAATAIAAPTDPVEYLGLWLLKYVENRSIVIEVAAEKEIVLKHIAEEEAEDLEIKKAEKLALDQRERSISHLKQFTSDPYILFCEAVQAVVKQTGAGACYIACLEEPVVPEPEVGDLSDEEEVPEDEGEGEGAEPGGDGEGEDGEEGKEPAPVVFDYRTKILNYVAASKEQEFMLAKQLLRLPKVYGEDEEPDEEEEEEEGAPPPTVNQGVTFELVDQGLNALDVPNVFYKEGVHFFEDFPRLGGYFAHGVKLNSKELRQLVCCDTLLPAGSGKPLSPLDKDYVAIVARTMSDALDHAEASRIKIVETGVAKSAPQELELELNPPPPEPVEPVEGEEGAEGEGMVAEPDAEAAPAEGEEGEKLKDPEEEEDDDDDLEEEEEEEEPEPEPEEDEDEEDEDDDEDKEPPPPPTVEECQAKVDKAKKVLKKASKAVRKLTKKLKLQVEVTEKETSQRELVVAKVLSVKEPAIDELRLMFRTPHATYRALKCLLYILGKEPSSFDNWTKCREYLNTELFDNLQEFDATLDRNMVHWKGVRACMKDLKADVLQSEAVVGDLLRIFILYTKKVAKACAAQRETEAALKLAEEKKLVEIAAVEVVQKGLDEALEREAAENPPPEEEEEGEGEEGEGGGEDED